MNFMAAKQFTEDELHYSAPEKIGNEVEVAIYARSASIDERKIENQISDCKNFIKSIGGDPEKAVIYADNGYAGSDDDRPAYRQLFRDAEEGKFQVLVIHDFPALCVVQRNVSKRWTVFRKSISKPTFPVSVFLQRSFILFLWLHNGGRE